MLFRSPKGRFAPFGPPLMSNVRSHLDEPARAFRLSWLKALESRFGEASFVKEFQCPGKPLIHLFYFEKLPETGCLTAVTCGLSDARHEEWKFCSPELIVTMQSESHAWGLAAGYFASEFFGERRFRYGDLFKVDDPISDEGPMNGYLVFAPSFLDKAQSKFELPDRAICLKGLYPIHDEEVAVYDRIGLEAFWHADGFEMYDPCRAPVRET